MNKISDPNQTVYIFDRIKFVKDQFKDADKIDRIIVHPLHLFILKYLEINPIVPKTKIKKGAECINVVKMSDIEDYSELFRTSFLIRLDLEKYFEIYRKREDIQDKREKLIYPLQKKIQEHITNDFLFADQPEKRIAIFKGYIDYFTQKVKNKPNNKGNIIVLNQLKKELKAWEQLIEKPTKKPQQNTLNGKKLNLLERYEIAKKIFNIDNQIRTLHITEAEKDKLLSLILDCNTTNARHIMNGKYPGKIREELISDYIQTLKK